MKHYGENLAQRLVARQEHIRELPILRTEGRLTRLVGLTLEATGCNAPIGAKCYVVNRHDHKIEAEIVGFHDNKLYLMCVGTTQDVAPGARIILSDHGAQVAVGEALLGRVINGLGQPLDGRILPNLSDFYPLNGKIINPLQRKPIREALDVGVKAINGMLAVGKGQRLGLFAGSGVGKSALLGMMTRFTSADVIVVGLIGERGREVKEFIEWNLGEAGLRRSVIVAAPADQSPLMRIRGALRATAIAEYFRDRGADVLLLMDSLTRFAQAQREIGLSIGEPPATKGYPPSVFARLPSLVERAGNGHQDSGSITAFYTVLVEGDDQQEPIADCARAILDGHFVLSRQLAEMGHYPAIDIESSISRVMEQVSSTEHQKAALLIKRLYSKYQQNRDLLTIGAYTSGNDKELDLAIELYPEMIAFLRQDINESETYSNSIEQLIHLANKINL